MAKQIPLWRRTCASSPVASSTATIALGGGSIQNQVHHLEFVEKGHFVFHTLLVEGLQDHMPGAVGCVAGPSHRAFAKVAGVAAEPALIDAALRGTVEGQPAIFQIINRLDGFFGQNFGRLLVHEIIAAFDGVEGMPLGFVLLHVAQCGADAALGCAGMTADGVELGKNRRFRSLAGFQGRIKPSPAGADDHRVVMVNHVWPPFWFGFLFGVDTQPGCPLILPR